jgi:hypothetical protein
MLGGHIMEFCNWMDKLPKIVKILFAIFLPILYIIYRLVKDIVGNANAVIIVLDILLGIAPVPFVFWILNLIWIISKDQVFDFAIWVK